MEEAVQLIGGYGDLAADGEGKCVIIAAKSSSAAAINNGGDYHHEGGDDDSECLPRKFKKYRSIVDIYQSTEPSEIINTTAKRRLGGNCSKKLWKRIMMTEKAANDEEEGRKAAAVTGNGNFMEVESLEEGADMDAWPTRNPKFRSILELYEITQPDKKSQVQFRSILELYEITQPGIA